MAENAQKIPTVKCPHCGVDSKTSDGYAYGSPFVKCHKCGEEYYDQRFHEIAISGIRPDDKVSFGDAMKFFLAGMVITMVCVLFNYLTSRFIHRIWFFGIVGVIFGIVVVVYSIYKAFTIMTGIEKRKWERLTKESEERVKDAAYVMRLRDSGYEMPEN